MVTSPNINNWQTNSSSNLNDEGSNLTIDEDYLQLSATFEGSFEEQLSSLEKSSKKSAINEQEQSYLNDLEKENQSSGEIDSDLDNYSRIFDQDENDNELEQIDAEKAFKNLLNDSGQQARLIQELQKQLDTNQQTQSNNLANSKLNELINSLRYSSSRALPADPSMVLDKQNLKLTMNFPMLDDLKSVQVQYDPSSRSITAEMITSQEAARVLQQQVAILEKNLAKHDIKLQSLKINGTEGNRSNQERQNRQNNQGQPKK
ncbi:MAG: hypothetical protein SFU25_09060 [Candidatus Caenarcaniphilales bacterium]|nr:hypothetical protein [Candidatus Caenarcaniphilales bacterium]